MKKDKIERVVVTLNEDGSFRGASVQHYGGDNLPRPLADAQALAGVLPELELAASAKLAELEAGIKDAEHWHRIEKKRAEKAEGELESAKAEREAALGRLEGALAMLREAGLIEADAAPETLTAG